MTDGDRELGVELGALDDRLDELDYPVEAETLFERLGDEEVTAGEETSTLEELLEPLGDDTYADPEAVESAILNMVGDAAIGRKGYSDRTPPAPGEDAGAGQNHQVDGANADSDQESF